MNNSNNKGQQPNKSMPRPSANHDINRQAHPNGRPAPNVQNMHPNQKSPQKQNADRRVNGQNVHMNPNQQKNTVPQNRNIKHMPPNGRKKIAENTPPPRRRNEESYVFSRSLSETRERILEERRERLEDAKQFRKEEISSKLKKGLIAFASTIVTIAIIVTITIVAVMNSGKVKKNDGEYQYKIGQNSSYETYIDEDRDGVLYISMNSLAELCNFSITGSENNLRFTTENGKDFVSFSPNSLQSKINGFGFNMSAPAIMDGRTCFIPLDFVDLVFDGLVVSVDDRQKTVTILRTEYNDSTPLEPHYVDISFMLKSSSFLPSLDENKYFEGQPLFSFKADIESYEEYMNPQGDLQDAFLILVNKDHTVGENYEPENLIEVKARPKDYWLVETPAKALEALMLEMRAEGFSDIFITSAYRSYRRQLSLYNTYINNEMKANPSLTYQQAQAIVETYSAVPGTSEHHTGLCVDFMSTNMKDLDNTFEDNEAFDWLMANAWKFGFILRYPEDKVDVTKYSYESWHWRYVGRTHALEIMRQGICLEEYLETYTK